MIVSSSIPCFPCASFPRHSRASVTYILELWLEFRVGGGGGGGGGGGLTPPRLIAST